MPAISWIIPAYNVGSFLPQAIESVQSQSFTDWEMIIVDDGSTDDTRDVALRYAAADPRITLLSTPEPSGSAILPRSIGVLHASAPLVAPLDADDSVGPDYLRNLLDSISSLGAEAVFPVMYGSDSGYSLPVSPIHTPLLGTSLPGRDCIRYTLDGWRIHCNGGLISRSLYLKALDSFPDGFRHPTADEILTRLILLNAGSVAFCDEKYLYRIHPGQITREISPRRFDNFINHRFLLKFIPDRFGKDSEEYRRIQMQAFHSIFDSLRLINSNRISPEARRHAYREIRATEPLLDRRLIRRCANLRYYSLFRLPLPVRRTVLKLIDSLLSLRPSHSSRQS